MLSKREREALAVMEAAAVARDPQWAQQFTENAPQDCLWRDMPLRLWAFLALCLLTAGIVSDSPVVDAVVMVILLSTPVAVLLTLARRGTLPASPES